MWQPRRGGARPSLGSFNGGGAAGRGRRKRQARVCSGGRCSGGASPPGRLRRPLRVRSTRDRGELAHHTDRWAGRGRGGSARAQGGGKRSGRTTRMAPGYKQGSTRETPRGLGLASAAAERKAGQGRGREHDADGIACGTHGTTSTRARAWRAECAHVRLCVYRGSAGG